MPEKKANLEKPEEIQQPRFRLGFKVFIAQALILSIAILMPAYFNLENQKQETLRHLQEQLLTASNTLSLQIKPADVSELNGLPSDTLKESYQRTRKCIVDFVTANHYLGFDSDNAYLFKRTEGDTLRFIAMYYSQYVGIPYMLRNEMIPVFEKGVSNTTDIYEDENGVWVSAYTPILDSTRRVIALVEVDFKNNFYITQLEIKKRNIFIIGGIAILLGSIFSLLLTFLVSSPIKQITNAVLDFSKGNRSRRVDIQSNDEIGTLASAFNLMSKEISDRDRITEEIRKARLEETIEALNTSNIQLEVKQKALEESNIALSQKNEQIKAQQLQLVQAEKMSSLGQMVAGIAHEINTPLGFVKNSLTLLSRNQEEIESLLLKQHALAESLLMGGSDDEIEKHITEAFEAKRELEENEVLGDSKKMLDHSKTGIERIEELVINLKNFSRLDETAFKLSDINEGIESTLVITNNAYKHKAEIKKNFTPDLKAECYPSQLNQVIMNLIVNAAQAIPEKGMIHISTMLERIDESPAANKSDAYYAVIEVSDTGKGISKENLDKIFDPFFTTKPVGQGTGLGLSISYQIIQKHKGKINVKSEVGKGTTFTVRIPLKQNQKS
ncbi:MAG: ATP-binding protein [Chloroherpetonaceae bacterium]|nr:ATP-binding protein [Chloroherpetonaceae bacterium]